jgi:maltokinase
VTDLGGLTDLPGLADVVAGAPGSLVLPDRPRGAEVEVPGPLRLLDGLDLGRGCWLAVLADATGRRWAAPLVVDAVGVRRAVAGDGAAEALARLIAGQSRGDTRLDGGFVLTSWHGEDAAGERAVAVDQTNDSVVVGRAAVVKWVVRLPSDPTAGHPAAARIATLVARGFTGIPRPWGQLCWQPTPAATGAVPVAVATVASFLPGAVDGWEWAVEDVRRLARGEIDLEAAVTPAGTIGALTARMHHALASAGQEPAGPELVASWTRRANEDLAAAVRLVDGPEGERLAARVARIGRVFDDLGVAAGTPLIDVHGDFHVGQVLRFGRPPGYAITDFDGNPVLPEAERTQRRPAALDVAGMLASLDHVGRVVIRRTADVDPAVVDRWIAAAQAAFLAGYRDQLAGAAANDLLDERLLAPLRLQQEIREYLYAVRHLPHWRYVPDAALSALLPDAPED